MTSESEQENRSALVTTPDVRLTSAAERQGARDMALELFDRRQSGHIDAASLGSSSAAPDLMRAPLAAGAALYRWTIATDVLEWSENASRVLNANDPSWLISGRGYAALLDIDNVANRYDTIVMTRDTDPGDGVPYSITYRIRPRCRDSAEGAWVEDTGRWYAGSDGKPAVALGMVRHIDHRYQEEERLHFLARFDSLTGHLNRSGLAGALEQAVAASNGRHRPPGND